MKAQTSWCHPHRTTTMQVHPHPIVDGGLQQRGLIAQLRLQLRLLARNGFLPSLFYSL